MCEITFGGQVNEVLRAHKDPRLDSLNLPMHLQPSQLAVLVNSHKPHVAEIHLLLCNQVNKNTKYRHVN